MEATLQRGHATKWDGLEPEDALIGGVLQQACKDAVQTANPALSAEAWDFLEICAPDIAARLHQQGQHMAAWHDLIQHVEALEGRGLTVATDYHGQGLPKWLLPALGDCDVFVLNVKNVPTDSTLCIVRLTQLEQLIAEAREQAARIVDNC